MNEPLIFGAVIGALVIWIIVATVRRLRRMKGYERAVRAYIGKDAQAAYDEIVMIRFYDHNMCAADAAREMISASRNTKGPV